MPISADHGADVDRDMMERALALAARAKASGEPAFGALIVAADGRIVAEATDEVNSGADFSLHAEVLAVRRACHIAGRELSAHTLYTTVEPCPMCFTAAWLARVGRIVYGASMDDVHAVTRGAQRELRLGAARLNQHSGEPLQLSAGVLAERCLALFGERPLIEPPRRPPPDLSGPELTKRNAALVLIDFQRDFCEVGGYADRLFGVDWAREALAPAQAVLRVARERGITIVHTREGYAPDLGDCPEQRQLRSRAAGAAIGDPGPLGRFLIRGEHGHDFMPELSPLPNELVIDKPSYGAFTRTVLERQLRARGIEHLYLTGLTADVCVHTTLREATDRGFFCHYVRDAVSTFDPELRIACERMVEVEGGVWGELTDSAAVIAQFDALAAGE